MGEDKSLTYVWLNHINVITSSLIRRFGDIKYSTLAELWFFPLSQKSSSDLSRRIVKSFELFISCEHVFNLNFYTSPLRKK